MKTRLAFVGMGVGVLLVIVIAFSLLLNRGPSNKDQLLRLAQQQQELIRVSEIGVKKARNRQAQDLAITAQLSLTSEQGPLQAALKSQGVKVSSKQLNAGKDAKTDERLTQAEQTNRFDEEFLEYLQAGLLDYQKNLKAAYDAAQSRSFKETLAAQYDKAATLAGVKPER